MIQLPYSILGDLIEKTESEAEVKILLKAIWVVNTYPELNNNFSANAISSDAGMALILNTWGDELHLLVQNVLKKFTRKGLLFENIINNKNYYSFPTDPEATTSLIDFSDPFIYAEPWQLEYENSKLKEIVKLYEQNISEVTPYIAENIKLATETVPYNVVVRAIEQASKANIRTWRYINAIIKSWKNQNREYGKTKRRTQTTLEATKLREYLKNKRG